MATKPTNLFRWASGGGAVITEPTSGKKDTGFGTTAEILAGELLNWLFNGAYQWFAYLDDLAAQAFTWTAAHAFNAGLSVPSGQKISLADNPAATTGVTNKLCAKNLPKAWARIQLNGTATPTIQNGFNIASVSAGVGGLSVSIADDLAGTTHSCPVAMSSIAGSFCSASANASGTVGIHIYDGTSGGAEWNPATQQSGQIVFLAVFGEQ